jgi:nickel-dependent lactate racemase
VDPQLVTDMHMALSTSLEDALEKAYDREGKEAKVVVIPDGLGVIVKGTN